MQSPSPEWKSRNRRGAPRDVQPPRKSQGPPHCPPPTAGLQPRLPATQGGGGTFPRTRHKGGTVKAQSSWNTKPLGCPGKVLRPRDIAELRFQSPRRAVLSQPSPVPVTDALSPFLVPASGPALPQASLVSLPPAPEAFTVTVSPFGQEGPRLRHRVERPGPAGPHIHAHCSLPRRPTTRPPPLPQSPATTGSWHAEAVRR